MLAKLVLISLLGMTPLAHADDNLLYQMIGETTLPPIGWVQFCADNLNDCLGSTTGPRDAVITETAWTELSRINGIVNEAITPMSDLLHWGVIEKWSLPTDGYGDCEDYVLLKRKMLIEHGWPREALLITLVADKKGVGHAVLTVKTDKGEFILDNQNKNVTIWTETGYRFFKRQSQGDPNIWVLLGDSRPETVTASAAKRPTQHATKMKYSYQRRRPPASLRPAIRKMTNLFN